MNHMEYFDCEMDIRQGNTGGRALLAFMPYNKNPKTPFSIVSLGLRQIAAYVALFPRYDKPSNLDYNTLYPLSTAFKVIQKRLANFHFFFSYRAERCGIHTKWSQSPTNPTTDFELTVKVKREQNGEKLFYRGRKTDIQIKLRANGQPAPRAYR